jgi:hypothetical protein
MCTCVCNIVYFMYTVDQGSLERISILRSFKILHGLIHSLDTVSFISLSDFCRCIWYGFFVTITQQSLQPSGMWYCVVQLAIRLLDICFHKNAFFISYTNNFKSLQDEKHVNCLLKWKSIHDKMKCYLIYGPGWRIR